MTGNADAVNLLTLFAEELRAHRAARGWSQADTALKVSYSESLIAQVETCRNVASMSLAKGLDRAFGTPGFTDDAPGKPGTPGTFMRLTRRIRKLSFPAAFRPFTDFEEEATALYIFEHAVFPGLYQIEGYARAVLATHPERHRRAGRGAPRRAAVPAGDPDPRQPAARLAALVRAGPVLPG